MSRDKICTICGRDGHTASSCTNEMAAAIISHPGTSRGESKKKKKRPYQRKNTSISREYHDDPIINACFQAVRELTRDTPYSEMLGNIFVALKEHYPEEYKRVFKEGIDDTTRTEVE